MFRIEDRNANQEKNPLARPWIAETAFDVASIATYGFQRYAISARARTAIFDFQANGSVVAAGTVSIWLGTNIGSLPWAVVNAGDLLCRPISVPDGTELTMVASSGAAGLLHITLVEDALSPGRFNKSQSSGGSGLVVRQGPLLAGPATSPTITFSKTPVLGNILLFSLYGPSGTWTVPGALAGTGGDLQYTLKWTRDTGSGNDAGNYEYTSDGATSSWNFTSSISNGLSVVAFELETASA